MAVKSAEEFFAVLEKSKLLIPSQLAQARDIAGSDTDPTVIARNLARDGLISRWQAGQLLAGRSSFYLGKYRLIELLGRGGMGSVFLCQHVMMNRRVALKVISRQVSKDRASLERFLAEARAIASLDHPNIVRAYSVDEEDDRYYLVMEYVEGLDLQRLVEEEGPLECDRAVDYIRQAADGLDHAHQRNMIHCDIKPSNLLVNMQGVVKILDLGLARLTGADEPDAASPEEHVLGSVDYLAPEQAMKSPNLDGRADIYALGCTLYYVLSGHPPFPQGTLAERILKHQTREPADLRIERPAVPAELAAICKRMMAKNPDDRYQTAGDLSLALSDWRALLPPVDTSLHLPKPKPLDELEDSEFFGIDIGEVAHGGASGKKAEAVRPTSGGLGELVATPQRILGLILIAALALAILAVVGIKVWSQRQIENFRAPLFKSGVPSRTPWPRSDQPVPKPSAVEPVKPETPVEQPPQPQQAQQVQPTPVTPPPEAPPQPTPPQPPPPPADPLAQLAEAADLPPLPEQGQPLPENSFIALGSIPADQAAGLMLALIGGDNVLADDRVFRLEPSASSPLTWIIRWEGPEDSAPPSGKRDVAKVSLAQNMLRFDWLPGATEVSAGYLSNCGLLATLGNSARFVRLRNVQAVEPILLELDRRSNRTTLSREYLSETDSLRLQVTGFSGPLPICESKTAEVDGPRGKIEVSFQDPALAKAMLRIVFEVKANGAQIDVSLMWQPPGQNRMANFNVKDAERMAQQIIAARNQFQTAMNSTAANSPKHPVLKQEVERRNAAIDQMTAMSNFYKAANKVAKLHFRLFNQFGDRQIDVFTTPAPGAPLHIQAPSPAQNVEKKGVKKRK